MTDKQPKSKGYVKKYIVYDGFSLSPDKKGKFCATQSHGCRTQNGVLMCGLGAQYLSIDGTHLQYDAADTPLQIGFLPYQFSTGWVDLPLVATAKDVYSFDTASGKISVAINSGAESVFANVIQATGEEQVAVVSAKEIRACGGGQWFKKMASGEYAPVACGYAYRLFVAGEGARLYYSAPYDCFNFEDSIDEGGYVDLLGGVGQIRQLIPLKKEMYCFFDGQIFRIVADGAARDFKATALDFIGGEIYAGSAAACGDEVVFWSREGLYKVKAGKVAAVKMGASLCGLRPKTGSSAVACEGLYILPCEADGEEKTLAIDLSTGECSATQPSLLTCAYHGGAYGMSAEGKLFRYQTGCPLEGGFVFERCGESFGEAGDKTLKSLCLYGEGEVELRVQGKHKKKCATLRLTAEGVKVQTQVKGKTFDIKIVLKTGSYLTKLQAETLQARL